MIRCIARGGILWILLLKFDLRVLGMSNTPFLLALKKRNERIVRLQRGIQM